MNNRIGGASSRVSENVGSNGSNGNSAPPYVAITPEQQADEAVARQATALLPWLVENHARGTLTARDVLSGGPAEFRGLTAARVRKVMGYLEAEGLVTAAGAPGKGEAGSGKRWLIQASDEVCRNLHLSDVARDAFMMTADLIAYDGEQVGRVLALALLHWMSDDPIRMYNAEARADAAIAAVAASGAGAA